MTRVLVVGAAPLPTEPQRRQYAANLRTWHFTKPLLDAGHRLRLVGCRLPKTYSPDVDPVTSTRDGDFEYYSVTGDFFHDRSFLQGLCDDFAPDAVVGVNTHPASRAVLLDTDKPIWCDLNGWIMAEAQTKTYVYDDDRYLSHFWKMERAILARADVISTVSGAQAHATIGELAVQGRLGRKTFGYEFVHAIPNAIAEVEYVHASRVARGVLVPDDAFVVLWVGGYNTWTDVDLLYDALTAAMAQVPRLHFVSTGGVIEGHDEVTFKRFQERVASSRFADRFHFVGWVPTADVPSYYFEGDLGLNVDSYNYETVFGARNRLNEMLKVGLPLLTTVGTEISRLVAEHEFGLTAPIGDAEAFAERMIWAAHHPERIRAMAAAGQAYVTEHLSYERTTEPLCRWAARPRRAPDGGAAIEFQDIDFFSDQTGQSPSPPAAAGPEARVPEAEGGRAGRLGRMQTVLPSLSRLVRRQLGRLRHRRDAAPQPKRLEEPSGPVLSDSLWAELAEFDADWYLKTYPDVVTGIAEGVADSAEDHYETFGAAEARSPNSLFAERWYRQSYPEVEAGLREGTYRSGFEHFLNCGIREGRLHGPLAIDVAWYLHTYPEVRAALDRGDFRDAFAYYLKRGACSGHSPHAAFDELWYREEYPDVAQAIQEGRYLCGHQHFLASGLAERRRPHPEYSEDFYRARNPDIDATIRSGGLSWGYFHLVSHGLFENRTWRLESLSTTTRRAATRFAHCRLDELLGSSQTLAFPEPEEPEVSIVLVLYNRAELTLACLESLLALRDVSFELVIVDNCSRDRTRQMLGRVGGARVLQNDENVGYTRAVNQAAAECRGRHLLFLNNDTEVLPTTLRSAVDRLQGDADVGAVGGRIVGLDGRLQEAGSIVWRDGSTEGYGRGDDPRSGAYLYPREVDYCSGVFLLTPRKLFQELGGYDLRFTPAYYEENDYCFRLRRHGYRVLYDPGSVVLHYETASLPDEGSRTALLRRNREVFLEIHGEELSGAYEPDVCNFFPAANRRRYRRRILVLDDHVPLESLGGGSPRTQEILHVLCELGCFVTFFATDPREVDWPEVRRELPEDDLELLNHLSRLGFQGFWKRRRDHYDAVVVCRPHNFRELLRGGFDPSGERAQVIYDAEAVVSQRRARQVEVLGPEAPKEGTLELDDEVALARAAKHVWAVTEEEGRLLAADGQRLSVVAHSAKGEPGAKEREERRGLLFVGRLDEEWNPNVDALSWYLTRVHPLLLERLGEEATLTVVGEPGDFDLPAAEHVRFLGRVAELAPVYDEHRLFVAPTRFAAGIPHKVTGAATHGVPVVATSLLVDQLGWRDGVEIADGGDGDPERFAARVAELYTDGELWHTLRRQALRRVREEHSRDALRKALATALDLDV